jgi:hypothetical protein
MGKFFKDNLTYDSEISLEKFFLYDVTKKQCRKKDSLLISLEPYIKEPKKELWKKVRKRPSFSEYPYEIDLLYISNLKEIRNFNHGIINSDVRFDKVDEIYKARKVIIENEAQLNKFIHGLHTNDSYDKDTWQICMLLSDKVQKFNPIWEGVF